MQNPKEIQEDGFTLSFLTSNNGESDWESIIDQALGSGGYVFQERIVAPASQAEHIVANRDRERCARPMVFVGHEEQPVQYSAIIALPVVGKASVEKLTDGFKLTSKGIDILFSNPLASDREPSVASFSNAFEKISSILSDGSMREFDITRTWLFMDELLNHYEFLNKARDEYFNSWRCQQNTFIPASTGIQGTIFPQAPLILEFCAFAGSDVTINQLSSPLQNEPTDYNKFFSRGVSVTFFHNSLLFISGTASINEAGESVYSGDFTSQLLQTLRVLEAMLVAQGGDFSAVMQAIVYVKKKEDLPCCKDVLVKQGFPGERALFLVDTDVCRDELLCEIELVASLQRGRHGD